MLLRQEDIPTRMPSDPGSDARDNDTSREDRPSDLYAPAEYVPDRTVRQPTTDENRGGTRGELEDLNNALKELRQLQADRYDAVVDVLHHTFLDVVPEDDDLYSKSPYPIRPMAKAWVYRLVAPSDGYSVVSWEQLEERLAEPGFAEKLKFNPENTPSERTLREHWWDRVRSAFRDHVRYMAAKLAVKCEEFGVETAEGIRENLVADFRDDGDCESDPIGEMEQKIKDDAYNIQANIIRDICSYDRDDSDELGDDLITDAAAHMCRRNEYAEQGIQQMGKDYGLIEENEDGSEEWNVFTQQTFRRTVRNVERTKVDG